MVVASQIYTQLELPPCNGMPPPTSQGAVDIHVGPDSYNTLKEDFDRIW